MTTNSELDRLVIESDEKQGQIMLAGVHSFLGRFVSYPSEDAQTAHALWCVHAHLMDKWESTPRIAFLSAEPASGKTRALEITELLVPNAVLAVNVSPAYLFRKVGTDESATILYDEIDTVFGPKAKENEDIRGLLNAGHRRGATVGRCVISGKSIETGRYAGLFGCSARWTWLAARYVTFTLSHHQDAQAKAWGEGGTVSPTHSRVTGSSGPGKHRTMGQKR